MKCGKPKTLNDTLKYYLKDMCVQFGYCIPPAVQEDMLNNLPRTPEEFVKRLMREDGVDPLLRTEDYNPMRQALIKMVGNKFP